ncbi:unnamed protein product [Mytilus coruscus]|uniref:YqaJ viral recombinase domain-containing protein n=1 Tax=Mytilus coruscus TaxID=42192 RepID=A0A6J8DWD7_MYTCO|nr:unnamed protein product [Mytilus coruscus]
MKASVRSSKTVVSSLNDAYIMCTREGAVEQAWCTFMAGLGLSCSHVGALLWKIEYAVRNSMTGVSCTNETAKWNRGTTRNIEPTPLVSIQLKKKQNLVKIGWENWLSASPDGIFDGQTLLEIKCPVPSSSWSTLDQLFESGKYDVGKDENGDLVVKEREQRNLPTSSARYVLYGIKTAQVACMAGRR